MAVVLFEDEHWQDFAPLTTLRHVGLMRWGRRTLLDSVRAVVGAKDVALWGRPELGAVVKASEEAEYNTPAEGEVLLLNARVKPNTDLGALVERRGRFVATSGDVVVAARIAAKDLVPGMLQSRRILKLSKGSDVLELPSGAAFRGCWQMVESNGMAIAEQTVQFLDQLELPEKTGVRGPASNLRVHGSAEVEQNVTFDTRRGPVVIDEGALIESFTRVSGPCYVGPRTKVHSALLREGTSVFEGCRIGGEVENSIIMPHTNKSHLGYVGDSVVGEWVNLGAGSTFSNLKNTYGSVRVEANGKRVDTGVMKFGPVIGDMAKVSINTAVYSGKCVGVASQVSGLVDRNVPSFTYYDGSKGRMLELRLDSVIETQTRMKERRGMAVSKAEELLIRQTFKATAVERRKAHVRKGKIG
jgi:UDP-N-acetylglucosamine diphosphorylase/glucosamine-1-phosphate N-acetyltransferase